jgi:hypothetical protein
MNYYYTTPDNEISGPHNLGALKNLLASGVITQETPVCEEGTEEWKSLSEILRRFQSIQRFQTKQQQEMRQPHAAPQPRQRARIFLTEEQHLADIRSRSCYKMLRSVINISAGVVFAAIIIFILYVATRDSERFLPKLILMGYGLGLIVLTIAARQSALLLVDIADTLLFEHNRNRNNQN